MAERTWLPADWMDEVTPTWGATPEAFVQRDTSGRLWFGPLDPQEDEDHPPMLIKAGWQTRFCWLDSFGTSTLTVTETGWSLDPEFPPQVEHFSIDVECTATSVAGLISGEGFWDPLEPGTYEVFATSWGDAGPFILTLEDDGTHRFVTVQ